MNKNKKAVVVVVSILLLLSVTIITYIALDGWFTNFQNDLYYKQIQGERFNYQRIKLIQIKNENLYPVLYVENPDSKNFLLFEIKLNSENCILDGGNAILANTLTRIYLNCPYSTVKKVNQVDLVTESDIFTSSVILRTR